MRALFLVLLGLTTMACLYSFDNPNDPKRCHPACGADQRCVDGVCRAKELDLMGSDGAKRDAPKSDGWPDQARPDAAEPDQTQGDASGTDQWQRDAAGRDQAQRDAAKPDQSKRDAGRPDAPKVQTCIFDNAASLFDKCVLGP